MMTSDEESVASSATQVTGLSESPRGFIFHGERFAHDWESVEHLLGKRTDKEIAERVGCSGLTVARMRKLLRIPRYRKTTRVRELMGRHPDSVVAELAGVSRRTVIRLRLAEGVPPCPRSRRRDLIRAKHARFMARMKKERG
jgi:hypothetical protein